MNVFAIGAPAVNGCGKPVEVADALVALTAAQYFVPLVRPVMLTATLWKVESVNPSAWAVVEFVGDPLVPPDVHHMEVASAQAALYVVACASGLTKPLMVAVVALVESAFCVLT